MIKKALRYSVKHEKKIAVLLKKISKKILKKKEVPEQIYKDVANVLLDFTVKTQNSYKKFILERDGEKHVEIVKKQVEEVKKWQAKQYDWIYLEERENRKKKALRQAELKARNVKGNLYASFLREIVSENTDYFIWETVGDDRVRDEHQDRDQQIYSFKYADLLPGEDPLCRCWATIILKREIN